MNTVVIILSVLVLLLYLKWILIAVMLPFQAIHCRVLKKYPHKKNAPLWARVASLPYKWWEQLFRLGWKRYMMFQVGEIPSLHLRRWIYKILGAEIGNRTIFHFRTEIRNIWQLHVGDGSIIGDNVLLDARRGLTIGKNVNIASDVAIYPGGHDIRNPNFGPPAKDSKPIVIGDRVYIGARAMILNGVTIGEGAVLCAGCIVTKDVEPYAIVAGIPAKKINERPQALLQK